jgi:hypothetical protein
MEESAPPISVATDVPDTDDQSTVYGVDVDDRSIHTRDTIDTTGEDDPLLGPNSNLPTSVNSVSDYKKPYLLKVVLLLMDPKTRRFELLQLEFDSLKALVSDVLNQIPVSVTEESLRKQKYTGICSKSAMVMTPEKLLATFCHGNDVLVAVPDGVTAQECTRLAKPILGDTKVMSMVGSLVLLFSYNRFLYLWLIVL